MRSTYPNGSIPYGDDLPNFALRVLRWCCAWVNHHPRQYTGAWSMGYGYVCTRCMMFADPLSDETFKALVDHANRHQDDPDFDLGTLCRRR